jgi:UPF0716 family protein affecting phage T7 exclusion
MIAAAVVGYAIRPMSLIQRIPLAIGGLFLIKPGLISDLMGIGIFIGILVWQKLYPGTEDHKRD